MINTVEKMDIDQDLERARKIIYEHDLTPTIKRMVLINKWSEKHAVEACKQYRNYLFLRKKYEKNYDLPPSYEIDEFWHAHILHTERYTDFCNQVFGFYLHHHPHHGKNNEISDRELAHMYEEQTQKLYLKEFGEYIYAIKPVGIQMKFLAIFENIIEFIASMKIKKPIFKS